MAALPPSSFPLIQKTSHSYCEAKAKILESKGSPPLAPKPTLQQIESFRIPNEAIAKRESFNKLSIPIEPNLIAKDKNAPTLDLKASKFCLLLQTKLATMLKPPPFPPPGYCGGVARSFFTDTHYNDVDVSFHIEKFEPEKIEKIVIDLLHTQIARYKINQPMAITKISSEQSITQQYIKDNYIKVDCSPNKENFSIRIGKLGLDLRFIVSDKFKYNHGKADGGWVPFQGEEMYWTDNNGFCNTAGQSVGLQFLQSKTICLDDFDITALALWITRGYRIHNQDEKINTALEKIKSMWGWTKKYYVHALKHYSKCEIAIVVELINLFSICASRNDEKSVTHIEDIAKELSKDSTNQLKNKSLHSLCQLLTHKPELIKSLAALIQGSLLYESLQSKRTLSNNSFDIKLNDQTHSVALLSKECHLTSMLSEWLSLQKEDESTKKIILTIFQELGITTFSFSEENIKQTTHYFAQTLLEKNNHSDVINRETFFRFLSTTKELQDVKYDKAKVDSLLLKSELKRNIEEIRRLDQAHAKEFHAIETFFSQFSAKTTIKELKSAKEHLTFLSSLQDSNHLYTPLKNTLKKIYLSNLEKKIPEASSAELEEIHETIHLGIEKNLFSKDEIEETYHKIINQVCSNIQKAKLVELKSIDQFLEKIRSLCSSIPALNKHFSILQTKVSDRALAELEEHVKQEDYETSITLLNIAITYSPSFNDRLQHVIDKFGEKILDMGNENFVTHFRTLVIDHLKERYNDPKAQQLVISCYRNFLAASLMNNEADSDFPTLVKIYSSLNIPNQEKTKEIDNLKKLAAHFNGKKSSANIPSFLQIIAKIHFSLAEKLLSSFKERNLIDPQTVSDVETFILKEMLQQKEKPEICLKKWRPAAVEKLKPQAWSVQLITDIDLLHALLNSKTADATATTALIDELFLLIIQKEKMLAKLNEETRKFVDNKLLQLPENVAIALAENLKHEKNPNQLALAKNLFERIKNSGRPRNEKKPALHSLLHYLDKQEYNEELYLLFIAIINSLDSNFSDAPQEGEIAVSILMKSNIYDSITIASTFWVTANLKLSPVTSLELFEKFLKNQTTTHNTYKSQIIDKATQIIKEHKGIEFFVKMIEEIHQDSTASDTTKGVCIEILEKIYLGTSANSVGAVAANPVMSKNEKNAILKSYVSCLIESKDELLFQKGMNLFSSKVTDFDKRMAMRVLNKLCTYIPSQNEKYWVDFSASAIIQKTFLNGLIKIPSDEIFDILNLIPPMLEKAAISSKEIASFLFLHILKNIPENAKIQKKLHLQLTKLFITFSKKYIDCGLFQKLDELDPFTERHLSGNDLNEYRKQINSALEVNSKMVVAIDFAKKEDVVNGFANTTKLIKMYNKYNPELGWISIEGFIKKAITQPTFEYGAEVEMLLLLENQFNPYRKYKEGSKPVQTLQGPKLTSAIEARLAFQYEVVCKLNNSVPHRVRKNFKQHLGWITSTIEIQSDIAQQKRDALVMTYYYALFKDLIEHIDTKDNLNLFTKCINTISRFHTDNGCSLLIYQIFINALATYTFSAMISKVKTKQQVLTQLTKSAAEKYGDEISEEILKNLNLNQMPACCNLVKYVVNDLMNFMLLVKSNFEDINAAVFETCVIEVILEINGSPHFEKVENYRKMSDTFETLTLIAKNLWKNKMNQEIVAKSISDWDAKKLRLKK